MSEPLARIRTRRASAGHLSGGQPSGGHPSADRPSNPYRVRTRALDFSGQASKPTGDGQVRVLKEYTEQRQLDDPFKPFYNLSGDYAIIPPPYNFASLLRLPTENNMLGPCIDAMVTNVELHGYRLEYTGPEGEEDSAEAQAEKTRLENLVEYPNDDTSLNEFRERVRRDLETTGNAFVEIGRDTEGRVIMFSHVPAHTLRLTQKDDQVVPVDALLPRDGKTAKQRVNKRFRRYVQQIGERKVYFKEYGDPRVIDPATGKENKSLPLKDSATEIYHMVLYWPGSAYGQPRWIGQLPSVLGTRQAELTNLDFFSENAIPALALLVSGGMITGESIQDIEDHINAVRGRKAMNRMVVIEAEGSENAAAENGSISAPRLDLRPLAGERQSDGLFLEYDKSGGTKIRASFRFPPIFVGLSDDYTYATAKTSFEVAESQVFGPERNRMDTMLNDKILASWQPKYWRFRSNPPRLVDPEDIVTALEAFDSLGAMTPNIAIGLANEYFDLEIETIDEDWGDYPFAVVKELAVAGKLEGMDEIVKEIDTAALDTNPAGGAAGEPQAGGQTAGGQTGDGQTGEPTAAAQATPQAAGKAEERVLRMVRKNLLSFRKALRQAA